jgi:hypothetical protein
MYQLSRNGPKITYHNEVIVCAICALDGLGKAVRLNDMSETRMLSKIKINMLPLFV